MSAQSETSPAKQTQDADTPNQSLPIHEFEIKDDEIEVEEIKGIKLFTIMLALCLAVFCVALDNTVGFRSQPQIFSLAKEFLDHSNSNPPHYKRV